MTDFPTLAEIQAARSAIAGRARRTPLVPAPWLAEQAGVPLFLKLETLQPTGSFKIRGAVNALSRLAPEQSRKGVVCASTGNHGRAVAWAARAAGVHATVCLPEGVPEIKLRAVEALGAEVRRTGSSQEDAQREVERLTAGEARIEVPPFDHPHVIAGQGTLGLEILEALPETANVVLPLSGGGLCGGVALALSEMPVRVFGVGIERGAAMAASMSAGRPVPVEELPTLADALAGGIGEDNRFTLALCREWVEDVVLVSEEEVCRAMQSLFRERAIIAEGAGAVGVAALLAGKLKIAGPTVVVVTGRNLDPLRFAAVVRNRPVPLGEGFVRG